MGVHLAVGWRAFLPLLGKQNIPEPWQRGAACCKLHPLIGRQRGCFPGDAEPGGHPQRCNRLRAMVSPVVGVFLCQHCRISPRFSPYLTRAGLLQVILRLTQLWQLRVSLLPLIRELRVEVRRAFGISALSGSARCTE